jgi:hypothetical protein
MLRFPLKLFPPATHKPYIPNAAISGGTPIVGPPQTADLSTGGVWVYELDLATVRSRAQIAVLLALVAELASGVTLIEVPVLDILQPWPGSARRSRVPFGDGSTFGDTGEFESETIAAVLAADVYMPASPAPPAAPTQAQITVTIGGALLGGEKFSLTGPSGNVRMHMITSISADDGAGNYTVTVKPPFREDTPAGTLLDFNDPRFTAKLDPAAANDAWPAFRVPYLGDAKLRFIESGFPGGAD